MMKNKAKDPEFQIRPEVAVGDHVNYFRITGSSVELILDFAKVMPELPVSQITNRIIITPFGLKNLSRLLMETYDKYIEQYGELNEQPMTLGLPKMDTSIAN